MSAALDEAIENLYLQFRAHTLAPGFSQRCSPLTPPSEAEAAALYRPLHSLSDEALSKYAFKANSTWGNEEDFRYFLPRLCELLAKDSYSWGPQQLIRKMLYCGMNSWPEHERQAVDAFFEALFPLRSTALSENWMVELSELKPFTHWLSKIDVHDRSPERLDWVIALINDYYSLAKEIGSSVYALRAWLLENDWEAALQDYFFATAPGRKQDQVSNAELLLRMIRTTPP